jgi:hypothetical protein
MEDGKARRILGYAIAAGIKNPKITESFDSSISWNEVFDQPGFAMISGCGKEHEVEEF